MPDRFIPNLLSIISVLTQADFSIREIRLSDIGLQEIEARTYDGPTLYFSLRFSADNALAAMQDVFASMDVRDFDYIDFRVENRVFYE